MSRPLLHVVTPDDPSGSPAISNEGADRDDLSNPAARRRACAGRNLSSEGAADAADAAPGGAAATAADASPRTTAEGADAEAAGAVIVGGGEAAAVTRLAPRHDDARLAADAAAIRHAVLAAGAPVEVSIEADLLRHLLGRGWQLQVIRRGVRAVRVRVLFMPPMHEART